MRRSVLVSDTFVVLYEDRDVVDHMPMYGGEIVEVTDDKVWARLQKRMQTGKLDSATVKKILGINEKERLK